MKQVTDGPFKRRPSRLNNHTGRFCKEDIAPIPLFDSTRRFSIIFVSASAARDATNLNRHLSAAGIRAYHAADAREVELLLAITRAKSLTDRHRLHARTRVGGHSRRCQRQVEMS